ncbi:hypothetical protein [Actinocorallia aurantiaca]|uniref:Tryptophan-associated transmembrane protein n=1 Tax=Actinocorallia aurantiaca TaxID=46204 RepID=A0ABN3UCW6_9ACTN
MRDKTKSFGVWIAVAAATFLNWAVWLGWDQKYDEHPDGTVSGPYEPWQVAGMVLVLAALVLATAFSRRYRTAILASTFGMAVSTVVFWSADESGLWAVGATMVVAGMLVTTTVAAAVVRAVHQARLRPASQP